jgi:hypothetical protein
LYRRRAGGAGAQPPAGAQGNRATLGIHVLPPPQPVDPSEIARKLVELKVEHRDLDQVIDRLAADRSTDQLQIKRLKKRKLAIKDMIAWLESKLIPDLDA